MTDAALPAINVADSADELESPSRRALRRLFKRKGAVAGLVVVATFILLALFAPFVAPYDPIATSWTLVRKAPSAQHWFGTDDLGRDILSRAMGNPRWRIALFHILPNILPALLVQATLSIAAAIIAEAALSFLGLGQQPPAPSWGSMLNAAQRFLTNAPWMAIWPGLAIFLVVLSLNLVGDGLRDALDPRAR